MLIIIRNIKHNKLNYIKEAPEWKLQAAKLEIFYKINFKKLF